MSDKSKISELYTIECIFDSLDEWRHLPAYQLERLAGVFFALFLPAVLEKNRIAKIKRPLIPEFPIRTDKRTTLSKKIDYFSLSEDGERALLIELKTDIKSVDEDQIEFIKSTAEKGVAKIILDILAICQTTKERAKYVHLLSKLSQLDLIEHEDHVLQQLHKYALPIERCGKGCPQKCPPPCRWRSERTRQGRKFTELLKRVRPAEVSPEVMVAYIQPEPEDSERIPSSWHRMYFDCFAEVARERGSIGRRFAESLHAWKEAAGSHPPGPR